MKNPTNTTVNVAVNYIGNTLGESIESPNEIFETGSTHEVIVWKHCCSESNDVTDDATDKLITLIAGLAARIQALEEAN